MSLEPGPLGALVNLARKAPGQEVDWITIADAQALTDQGLARRDRQGWRITDADDRLLESEFLKLGCAGYRAMTRAARTPVSNGRGEPRHWTGP